MVHEGGLPCGSLRRERFKDPGWVRPPLSPSCQSPPLIPACPQSPRLPLTALTPHTMSSCSSTFPSHPPPYISASCLVGRSKRPAVTAFPPGGPAHSHLVAETGPVAATEISPATDALEDKDEMRRAAAVGGSGAGGSFAAGSAAGWSALADNDEEMVHSKIVRAAHLAVPPLPAFMPESPASTGGRELGAAATRARADRKVGRRIVGVAEGPPEGRSWWPEVGGSKVVWGPRGRESRWPAESAP